MNKLVTISKIWNYFQGCSNSENQFTNGFFSSFFIKVLVVSNLGAYKRAKK